MGQCQRCGWCCQQEDCEYLHMEGGKTVCTIHDQERPQRCGEYPANPPIVHEGCGYEFYDTWENKVVKGIV